MSNHLATGGDFSNYSTTKYSYLHLFIHSLYLVYFILNYLMWKQQQFNSTPYSILQQLTEVCGVLAVSRQQFLDISEKSPANGSQENLWKIIYKKMYIDGYILKNEFSTQCILMLTFWFHLSHNKWLGGYLHNYWLSSWTSQFVWRKIYKVAFNFLNFAP